MDNDRLAAAHALVAEEANRISALMNERTEALLSTLQSGESLAVRVLLSHMGTPVRVFFQIILPGMAPERGYEWTVYGPKP